MAVASTALVGPDAVVFLGEESRSARSTIRRALLIGQFSVIGLYLLYSYAVTLAWGPDSIGAIVALACMILGGLYALWRRGRPPAAGLAGAEPVPAEAAAPREQR